MTAQAVPVEVVESDDGWQLLRNGEPYFIKGAGGTYSLEAMAAAGANSIRTWDAENIGTLLDEAHALGMTVSVGIWLGHERHGFDYDDADQVATQLERVRSIVERYKHHPAVLLWGLGNEMEGFDDGDDPAIWRAVNDIAAMVKALDPNHPTMTTTAFTHGARIEYVHQKSPAIDIHGINAYGGAQVVPELLLENGASKPFVLTEFGPVGPWEAPTTAWGAPIEQTSTEKAAFLRESYENGVAAVPGRALGAYAFLWGNKMEATHTWFGMFLSDGAKTAAVDTMTEIWSGKAPDNYAPTVAAPQIAGASEVDPGDIVEVKTRAADPEGQALSVRWELRPESGEYLTGGDFRPDLPEIEGAILEANATGARVKMPENPGAYRLFVYAYDEVGNAATANLPLRVKGHSRTRLPLFVYHDDFGGMPWVPSGWMGNVDRMSLDGDYADDVYEGRRSIRLRYEGKFGWVGVAWQHPANNWGETDGGFDLDGAGALELWARGEYGGEKVSFGVGLLETGRAYPDSGIAKVDGIVLTHEWQRYRVPLNGIDLSSIKTGFVVTLNGRRTPVTIYLDSIRFVP